MSSDQGTAAAGSFHERRARQRRALLERRGVAVVVMLVVGGWLVFVFANAIGQGGEVGQRAAVLREENQVLAEQVAAARAEASFVATLAFVEQEARAYGFGDPGERPFALKVEAPEPPPIALLGADLDEEEASAPIDDWMELLFGA